MCSRCGLELVVLAFITAGASTLLVAVFSVDVADARKGVDAVRLVNYPVV
jgi:hypothetical protein